MPLHPSEAGFRQGTRAWQNPGSRPIVLTLTELTLG